MLLLRFYRVCHVNRLTKWDDKFWAVYDHFLSKRRVFEAAGGNWLMRKTKADNQV